MDVKECSASHCKCLHNSCVVHACDFSCDYFTFNLHSFPVCLPVEHWVYLRALRIKRKKPRHKLANHNKLQGFFRFADENYFLNCSRKVAEVACYSHPKTIYATCGENMPATLAIWQKIEWNKFDVSRWLKLGAPFNRLHWWLGRIFGLFMAGDKITPNKSVLPSWIGCWCKTHQILPISLGIIR